jgi:tetrahydromethanopterin S-methyltransferase subunit F
MNQSEDVSPSESSAAVSGSTPSPKTASTSGAWSKSIIGFLIGFVTGVILLTFIYLVYTSMSTTDSIFSMLKALGYVIAIILLIVLIAVLFYRNSKLICNESKPFGFQVALV